MIIDCHNHVGASPRFTFTDFPYAQDVPTLVNEGRRHGITHWVVFPFSLNLTFDFAALRRGDLIPGRGVESIPYAFENRRLATEIHQFFPEFADRLIQFASVDPSRHQAAQVGELVRLCARWPIHGLKIQATTIQARVIDLLEGGRVLLEFAEANDLPFIIHSSVAANDPWSPAADILKVVEATPKVRFCLAHSCRFDRPFLDRVAELPNAWFDVSAHGIHCAGAARNMPFVAEASRRVPADYADPPAVLRELADRYPHKLLWGSDSPFYSFINQKIALKSSYAAEAGYLNALPAEARRRVAGDNTLQFLRLKPSRRSSRSPEDAASAAPGSIPPSG